MAEGPGIAAWDVSGQQEGRPDHGSGESFERVLQRRMSRRQAIKAGVVASAVVMLGSGQADGTVRTAAAAPRANGIGFAAIAPDTTDLITVSPGYRSQVLLSWGDPLAPGLPAFDTSAQSASLQEQRFGFNCDFVAYNPLPLGSGTADDGLLWVNHDYTDGLMMFPGYDAKNPSPEQVDIELAAHGATVVQIRRGDDGTWSYDEGSPYNRRITAMTPMTLAGPAAGDVMMQTAADPSGRTVLGMLNNCGGGWTPWGTVLTCEENFNQYCSQ